ncbi:hypothetical protein [Cupriavidus sp. CP313]
MHLTQKQIDELHRSAEFGGECLDRVISRIRDENPAAFHTRDTLCERVFVDQPLREEPCMTFLRFAVKHAEAA